jgi:pimeloyl-ACP methyl ester carboxylesterase
MPGWVVLFTAIAAVAGSDDDRPLIALGGDPARGVLIDLTPGLALPGGPTVVFVHGANPAPGIVHFEMAERLAEALGRRDGPPCRVLAWAWNAATSDSHWHKVNDRNAIGQGHILAAALLAAGVPPEQTQLIGHSAGSIVATSAAHDLAVRYGRPLARLTLLDPAICYHRIVFEQLHAGTTAQAVENYWAPGPSGFGRAVACPHVWNVRVAGPSPWLGVAWPLRSSHLFLVRWYLSTAEDAARPGGFNTSLPFVP